LNSGPNFIIIDDDNHDNQISADQIVYDLSVGLTNTAYVYGDAWINYIFCF